MAHTAPLPEPAALLDLAHDAIFVREYATGAIQYWNRGAEALYGWPADAVLGHVSHELLRTIFPQSRESIEAEVLETGSWDGELIHDTVSGETVVVQSRWAVWRDSQGTPRAFLEVNRDVTQRRRAEEHAERLNEELAVRAKQLSAVNGAMTSISRGFALSRVLQNITEAACELVHARYAALGVADEDGRITDFITVGITPEQRKTLGALPQGHGLLGALITERKPIRTPAIGADPRSYGFPPHHPSMTSLLGVPIQFRDTVVGNLYLTDKLGAEEFSQADEDLLLLLAAHAGVAIQNARLYDEVLATRDRLQLWNQELEAQVATRTREIERQSHELTTGIIRAQEEERRRIARELHDDTAQALTVTLIALDVLEPLLPLDNSEVEANVQKLRRVATRALDGVRALAQDLRPSMLDDFGLVPALRLYAQELNDAFRASIEVHGGELTSVRLPSEIETTLFRVAQEALMNAAKYAKAGTVTLTLERVDGRVRLVVRDDGRGFVVGALSGPTRRGGMGLFAMRERVALVGGSLDIASAPGKGTIITAWAPLPTEIAGAVPAS